MSGRSPSGRVTLAEVARLAGVSSATASKALNGRSDVSERTRSRVLAVIEDMGYRPTTERRDPGRPRALVAVLDGLETLYTTTVLSGIVSAATALGTDLILRVVPDPSVHSGPAAARAWIDAQRQSGASGIIVVTSSLPDAVLHAADSLEMPLVAIDPIDTSDSRLVSVGSANWSGGRSATEHVIGLGHRRIAWIGGPVGSAPSIERFHGYQAAQGSAGLVPDPSLIGNGAFSVETGLQFGRQFLDRPDRPTAIVAGNDEIAVGVLVAARELRVPVPAELSVVGFDDTPQTMWTTPRLTSVRQPMLGMGRMAVETVLGMAAGVEPASRHVQLATTLMVRDSTAPAPGRTTP